jgi:mannose-1-phosphate guanylyltransferase/mannose-6-phosphate isomerase
LATISKNYPKEFIDLIDQDSLFQKSALRLRHLSNQLIIVTNNDHRFLFRHQLHEIGTEKADVIIEAEGKNTAPAILAAPHHVNHSDPDAIMLVMPSDHYIPFPQLFSVMINKAASNLSSGQIICFGIKPDYPKTASGYIKFVNINDPVKQVLEFTENPDIATAQELLLDDSNLWNSGIFMMRADQNGELTVL